MAQIENGIRKILEVPAVYRAYQSIVGAGKLRRTVIQDYLKLSDGLSVLDVGCGPGLLLADLPSNISYTGFDQEERYIEEARLRFSGRGEFHCEDVSNFQHEKCFDRIVIIGVLHHLDDSQVDALFEQLRLLLKPDGFLVAVENVYVEDQSRFARYLISKDRGQNTRTPEGYLHLNRKHFPRNHFEIRHDLIHVPFTNIVIVSAI